MESGTNNYETQVECSKKIFLQYDQEEMIEKFKLNCDAKYLYLYFFDCQYRIDRQLGDVQRQVERGEYIGGVGYNEVMSIYDVLCYAKGVPHLSGQWSAVTNLRHTIQGNGHSQLFDVYAQAFDGQAQALKTVCEQLPGRAATVGDVSYIIDVFEFFPIMLQFWEGDDEFAPRLKLLWDENTLDYLHYETTYFIAFYLFDKLKERLDATVR